MFVTQSVPHQIETSRAACLPNAICLLLPMQFARQSPAQMTQMAMIPWRKASPFCKVAHSNLRCWNMSQTQKSTPIYCMLIIQLESVVALSTVALK